MKKILSLFCISIIVISCAVDSSKIIGRKIDMNLLPYGKLVFFYKTTIDGVIYRTYGANYLNRVLVYVCDYDSHIITDYYFSGFVDYNYIKDLKLGTSYDEIVNTLGKPFTINYFTDDLMGITYLPKFKNRITWNYATGSYIVYLGFNSEGKLINFGLDKVPQ